MNGGRKGIATTVRLFGFRFVFFGIFVVDEYPIHVAPYWPEQQVTWDVII